MEYGLSVWLVNGCTFVYVLISIVIEWYMLMCSYMVTHLMGADLNNIVKTQRLSDDHVQFLVYQILRGLKVCTHYASSYTIFD